MQESETLAFRKAAQEHRESWPVRALVEAKHETFAVLLSVLAHSFDDAMLVWLHIAFPGFTSITAPFLCSAGKVSKSGAIVADVVQRDGTIKKHAAIYANMTAMQNDFRRLADAMNLTDADRLEMFGALKRWVVADYRLDPAMDPKDPDAVRLH